MSLKKIKYYLYKYERIVSLFCQILLGIIILLRLAMAYRTALFTDTRFFVETANWVRQGLCPYKPEVFLTKFGAPPMQSPSMSLLAMPLCFTPKTFQNCVFFSLGILAFFSYVILVFNYFGFNYKEYLKAADKPSQTILLILSLAGYNIAIKRQTAAREEFCPARSIPKNGEAIQTNVNTKSTGRLCQRGFLYSFKLNPK